MARRSAPPSTVGHVRDVFPELGELTHLAFYAGWPNAGSAALVATEVCKERGL